MQKITSNNNITRLCRREIGLAAMKSVVTAGILVHKARECTECKLSKHSLEAVSLKTRRRERYGGGITPLETSIFTASKGAVDPINCI